MARALHQHGISAADTERMTPFHWARLHSSLKEAGILGRRSTFPSFETVACVLVELRILEQSSGRSQPHLPGAA
jgi:hypothetical protein